MDGGKVIDKNFQDIDIIKAQREDKMQGERIEVALAKTKEVDSEVIFDVDLGNTFVF